MSEIINLCPASSAEELVSPIQDAELVEIADGILLDTRASMENRSVISMPIAQLATLGAGVSSLIPALRTVTQTTTINADGLYRLTFSYSK